MSQSTKTKRKYSAIITLLIGLFFLNISAYSQTKIDEYSKTDSDSESGRMDNFLIELQNKPESKALIVQYANSKQIGFGNLSSHIKGVKEYLKLRIALSPERYSIQIKVGKPRKELWIYPKDVELPKSDIVKLETKNISKSFLYAQTCIECGPAVPLLAWDYVDFEYYANFINTNDDYKGLIVIYQDKITGWSKEKSYQASINYVIEYRKLLVEEYGISKNKLKIVIRKPIVDGESPAIAKFYILPNKK